MTSTSSEPVVLRGVDTAPVPSLDGSSDLRRGRWTRLGDGAIRGDAVTEAALADLTERSRMAARAQGYAAGWAEGRRKAVEDAEQERLERTMALDAAAAQARRAQTGLVAGLTAAVERVGVDVTERWDELKDHALDLALLVAEAVLQRELAVVDDVAAEALRRALADIPVTTSVAVRLNPVDLGGLDPRVVAERPVRLVADATVGTGEAYVETETSTVDATISGALQRVREALTR